MSTGTNTRIDGPLVYLETPGEPIFVGEVALLSAQARWLRQPIT